MNSPLGMDNRRLFNHSFAMKISISLLCFLSFSQIAQAVTLKDAFAAASEHESILIQESRVRQFDEQVDQAKSGILPQVSARGSYLVQQDAPIFSAPTLDRSRKAFQVELVQPLYQGFREFAAMRLAEGERLAQQAQLERSKIELFSELYEVFFAIVTIEEDLKNMEELLRLSQERVRFLQRRVDIGRSRQSELISARAQMLTVRSQLEGTRSQLIRYRERFHSLTGLSQESSIELEGVSSTLEPMETYLEKSLGSQWLAPERLRFESAGERVNIARADHLPSVDLRANYYPYREGTYDDVKWDVTFNLTIPIYQGGVTQSRVREVIEQKKEAELDYRLQQRNIRENVRTAYQSLERGRSQVSDYRDAVNLNRENYELQQREYGLGLVSNLDVLQALNQYIQSRRDLSGLRLENSQYYYELMALTGDIFEVN